MGNKARSPLRLQTIGSSWWGHYYTWLSFPSLTSTPIHVFLITHTRPGVLVTLHSLEFPKVFRNNFRNVLLNSLTRPEVSLFSHPEVDVANFALSSGSVSNFAHSGISKSISQYFPPLFFMEFPPVANFAHSSVSVANFAQLSGISKVICQSSNLVNGRLSCYCC